MMNSEKISLTEFAARRGVHPATIRRATRRDPSFPQPTKLPSGHLAFDLCEVERYERQSEAAPRAPNPNLRSRLSARRVA